MLHRYAPGLTEGDYTTDFLANPRASALRACFETAVPSNATALAVLAADSDLAFLLDNYHGDLLLGLAYALDIIAGFVQQLLTRKEAAQALFALHMIVLVLACYVTVFLGSTRHAALQCRKAVRFVRQLPLHCLDADEVALLARIFDPASAAGTCAERTSDSAAAL